MIKIKYDAYQSCLDNDICERKINADEDTIVAANEDEIRRVYEGYDDIIEEELEIMEDAVDDGDEEFFLYEELFYTQTIQDQIDYLNETRL